MPVERSVPVTETVPSELTTREPYFLILFSPGSERFASLPNEISMLQSLSGVMSFPSASLTAKETYSERSVVMEDRSMLSMLPLQRAS